MYQYTVGVLFFVAVWAVIFIFSPGKRGRILTASLIFAVAGPIVQYWHCRDYWHPVLMSSISIGQWTFGIEDFLFAGALAGIGVGFYEPLIQQSSLTRTFRLPWKQVLVRWISLIGCSILALWVLTCFMKMNSLSATIVIMLVLGLLVGLRDSRKVIWALPAGLSGGGLIWLFYWGFYFSLYPNIIRQWWESKALCGITLAGVPLEEVIWGAVATGVIGPVFHFLVFAREED